MQQAQAALTQMGASTQQATDALTKLRQAQTQAADALTQQRQASTQATGALTQLRDAQTQATQAATQAKAAALAYKQSQDQLTESLRQQREAQAAANAEAGKAGAIWQQALGVAGGIGIATSVSAIVMQMKALAVASVEAATKQQSLIATFTAIEGSASKGSVALAFLRAEAGRIGVDFVSTATAYKGLDAAARGTSLEGQKTRDIFIAISEASRVLGLSGTETSRILMALQQVISKGKVSSEELRQQIGESLPGAFAIAARAMGVTGTELDKMLSTGKVMAEDFLPKFAAQIRKEFGPGLAAAAETAAATFARLGNETQALSVRVGNSILVLLKPIADVVTTTLKNVRTVNEEAERRQGQAGASATAGKPVYGAAGPAVRLPGTTAAEAANLTALEARLVALQRQTDVLPATAPILRIILPQIAQLEAEYRALNDTIKARAVYNAQLEQGEDLARGTAGQAILDAQKAQKKGLEEIAAFQKQLPLDLQKATVAAKDFPSQFEKAATKLKVVEDSIKKLNDMLEAKPSLRSLPAVQEVINAHESLAKALQAEVKAEKKADADIEKAAKQRERLIEIEENFQRKMRQIDPTGKTALQVLNEQLSLAEQRTKSLDDALGKLGRATGGAGLPASEQTVIQRIAATHGVDPAFLGALRRTENGRAGREFGVLSVSAPTYEDQARIAAQTIKANERRYTGTTRGEDGRYTPGFIDFFSSRYAPLGASNDPTGLNVNHASSLKKLYGMDAGSGAGTSGGTHPLLRQAQSEEAALRVQAGNFTYTEKLEKEVAAADHDSRVAHAKKLEEGEAIIAQLDRMTAAYAKPKEARDEDTASALVAKAVMTDEIATRAKLAEGLLLNAIAEKEHADAVEKAVKVYDRAEQSLDRYQEQLGLSGGGKITAEARAVTRAEKDLLALRGGPREAEAQKVVDGLKLVAKEAEPEFQRLTRLSEDFADSFLSTMERATQGGIKSFKEFAQSVLQDLMRMASQEYLKPQLNKWIDLGLKALRGIGGTSAEVTAAAGAGYGSFGEGMASGGPVTSNTPYVVGERGPEVFVPSQNGTIVPHGASGSRQQGGQAPPMIVNIYGVQDAAGLARSRGEIQRQMLSAFQQAQRAA